MSLGLVPSDIATSNARVAQNLVATNARFGTLTTTDLVTDRVTTAVVDTSVLNATEVVATTETVGTLTADSITADTGNVTALTTAGLTCTGNATISGGLGVEGNAGVIGDLVVQGSAQVNGTITAAGFPHSMTGQFTCVSDGKTALFDYYVNPGFMDFNDVVVNTTRSQHAVWCVPRDITVTGLEVRSTGIDGAAVQVTLGMVYGTDIDAVNLTVFSSQGCTNSGYTRTGSVAIPAGSFMAMHFSGSASAATTYNSWIMTYY